MSVPLISLDEFVSWPDHHRPHVDATSPPRADDVLTVVDLDAGSEDPGAAARALARSTRLTLGVAREPWSPELRPAVEALTLTVTADDVEAPGRAHVPVPDPDAQALAITDAVARTPRAALSLANLLRITGALTQSPADAAQGTLLPREAAFAAALSAESFAYSALLAGPEFAAWRAAHPPRPEPPVPDDAVLLARDGDTLRITLNRPDRRNALGHGLRDALIDALDLVAADPALHAELRGAGPSFCSGGDLDEFGTAADPATAHVVRVGRSAGLLLHHLRDRVTPYVHGACVGAGIEVPAFAATVVAAPSAWCQLPELALGLVPGAGGTVSVTHRIGRWRTAWMVLTGARVPAEQALRWGLFDRITGA